MRSPIPSSRRCPTDRWASKPASKWDAGYTDALQLVSSQTIASDIDTERNLYVFAANVNGTPSMFAKSRLYWLKLNQGGYVRKFQPVRLKNGLVALWDYVEEKAHLSKTAAGGFVAFSAVGPETEKAFNVPLVLIIR